ncbi:MAG: hypothetical protein KIT84_27785 [Labilithrix sp.]|nr:hypothetical protein [Labilithrix sp.]MCW5814861.1 hypothetical protein [Labilithrix sp.]
MDGRLIVSFRAVGGPGRPFLERARSLIARYSELGGVHVGFDVMKITFAFDAANFASILEASIAGGEENQGEEPLWAVGMAQGDIRPVKDQGSDLMSSGVLWWGPPIVAASALSQLARPGEILVAQTIPALRSGELVTSGLRIAREGTLRVRGRRVDRRQPWRRSAAENLARMREPRLVGAHLPNVPLVPGQVSVLRADPGAGGTRLLYELAVKAPRALVISPTGSGFEPLGALRRAFVRSIGGTIHPLLLELAQPLDDLLKGRGTSAVLAAKLLAAFLWPKQSGTSSALIIDDAKAVDPATLEACVRAVKTVPTFGIIARLDATSGLPSVLAALPKASEHEIPALSREGAEDIAVGASGGALDPLARGRWARLGGGNALAIVEGITLGIASGDLTWQGERATPRSRAAGRGKVLSAAKWIRRRANAESTPARALLSVIAVLGGDAKATMLVKILERANIRIDVAATLQALEKSRWIAIRETRIPNERGEMRAETWVSFPARTHHKALFNTLEDDARKKLHLAIARVIEEEQGAFGRVEAAWHAAQGGETTRAAQMLVEGAAATSDAHFEASTTQLIAFARRVDPACEPQAVEILSRAVERASAPPPPVVVSAPPPTVPQSDAPPFFSAPFPSTEHASIPVPRSASMQPAPSQQPPTAARIAAIASVPPMPHTRGTASPRPVSIPPTSRAPLDLLSELAPAPPEGAPAEDEPDSLIEHARIVAPKPKVAETEPPTMSDEPRTASGIPPNATGSVPPSSQSSGSQVAARIGELAKEALLAADNAALERWVDGLRASGESPAFAERLGAMARLGRGDIGDALRVLRRTRQELDPNDHRRRCQTSLALGVALSVAHRPDEALLESLDALARARQIGDERGAKACLAFLAKLYSSTGRDADGERLRQRSL